MGVKIEVGPRNNPGGNGHSFAADRVAIGGNGRLEWRNSAEFQRLHVFAKAGVINPEQGEIAIMGDKLDREHSMAFVTGAFVVMPAKHHHFAWTREETMVEIHSNNPFDIVYVNAADDPRQR